MTGIHELDHETCTGNWIWVTCLQSLIDKYWVFFPYYGLFYDYFVENPCTTLHMSRLMTTPTKRSVRPAKTQISLGIRQVWSESSLCAFGVAKDPNFHHADSEGWRMPRLIWVFAGRTGHFVGVVMRRLILHHSFLTCESFSFLCCDFSCRL